MSACVQPAQVITWQTNTSTRLSSTSSTNPSRSAAEEPHPSQTTAQSRATRAVQQQHSPIFLVYVQPTGAIEGQASTSNWSILSLVTSPIEIRRFQSSQSQKTTISGWALQRIVITFYCHRCPLVLPPVTEPLPNHLSIGDQQLWAIGSHHSC